MDDVGKDKELPLTPKSGKVVPNCHPSPIASWVPRGNMGMGILERASAPGMLFPLHRLSRLGKVTVSSSKSL